MELADGNLNEAENIFLHLLDDEKMFNPMKFKKALLQLKSRKADDYNRALRKGLSSSVATQG
jgi:hypothetical protein